MIEGVYRGIKNRNKYFINREVIMDLSSFDLEGLQSLHLGYQRVLANHKDLQSQDKDLDDKVHPELLKLKIDQFETQLLLIGDRINYLNSKKLRFSVEYMKWHFGAFKRVVQVHFITTSDAYKTYGEYVTGMIIMDNENLPKLLESVRVADDNDGIIKFEEIVSEDMPREIKEKLKTNGFLASEIRSIS